MTEIICVYTKRLRYFECKTKSAADISLCDTHNTIYMYCDDDDDDVDYGFVITTIEGLLTQRYHQTTGKNSEAILNKVEN